MEELLHVYSLKHKNWCHCNIFLKQIQEDHAHEIISQTRPQREQVWCKIVYIWLS